MKKISTSITAEVSFFLRFFQTRSYGFAHISVRFSSARFHSVPLGSIRFGSVRAVSCCWRAGPILYTQNHHERGRGGGAHLPPGVEMHFGPAAEARRVIVPQSLGVPERLQDRVGVEDALLHGVLISASKSKA